MMSIVYEKHPDYPDSILIRNFRGTVSVTEIIESWESLISNKMITPLLRGVINNITDCNLKMDMESFKTLAGYLKQNTSLKGIKLAVIVTDPKMIVFPTVAQTAEKELKIKPFSTLEAAVEWIQVEL